MYPLPLDSLDLNTASSRTDTFFFVQSHIFITCSSRAYTPFPCRYCLPFFSIFSFPHIFHYFPVMLDGRCVPRRIDEGYTKKKHVHILNVTLYLSFSGAASSASLYDTSYLISCLNHALNCTSKIKFY